MFDNDVHVVHKLHHLQIQFSGNESRDSEHLPTLFRMKIKNHQCIPI